MAKNVAKNGAELTIEILWHENLSSLSQCIISRVISVAMFLLAYYSSGIQETLG